MNRRKHMGEVKAMRKKERLAKEHLLAEVQAREELERSRLGEILLPYAEKLAALMTSGEAADECMETKVVDIGVNAWRIGELNCMRQLHSMAMDICGRKCQNVKVIDYISIWWDGIGSWRNPWLEGESEPISQGKGILCGP